MIDFLNFLSPTWTFEGIREKMTLWKFESPSDRRGFPLRQNFDCSWLTNQFVNYCSRLYPCSLLFVLLGTNANMHCFMTWPIRILLNCVGETIGDKMVNLSLGCWCIGNGLKWQNLILYLQHSQQNNVLILYLLLKYCSIYHIIDLNHYCEKFWR